MNLFSMFESLAMQPLFMAALNNMGAEPKGLGKFIRPAFTWLLETLYSFTEAIHFPNWVLTIFLFTLIVRLLVQPLMNKQMRSSRKMQLLQPEVEELKRRYAGNPQKLNQETMKLYKENGASPTAGCLPMLIQMPILISLFNAIRFYKPPTEAMLATFHFPLIHADSLALFSNELPGLNGWVLPVIAAAATFLQQWLTSPNLKDQSQKMMLIIFPIMFLFMVRRFPVLMAIYWVFYSLLSAGIQFPLMKRWERIDRAKIEAVRAERAAEESAKREKKAVAKETAERVAAERRAKRAASRGYAVEEGDFDEGQLQNAPRTIAELNYTKVVDDEEDACSDEAFQAWLDANCITVQKKKERLHPYSDEETVNEFAILLGGKKLALSALKSSYLSAQAPTPQEQAQQLKESLGFFGRKKKAAGAETEDDGCTPKQNP